jgi:hypothetical protein
MAANDDFVVGEVERHPVLLHERGAKYDVVVTSTKTPELIPIFLKFFRSLYAPVPDHVTPALILAELPH